jgi:hypothetical protein
MLRAPDVNARPQGLAQMRKALSDGLENYMPVSAGIKDRLAQSKGD